ncbi:glycosyltransferase [uncultured Sphingomonas sp.]|uniref:glycosyltransferase n=1 Tax=uncultured Sphingomonas sp. TaxID=158754 RepID=UPI0035CBE61E
MITEAVAVAIVIPTLDEATTLPRLARLLAALDPRPAELILVDGGSTDGTADFARMLGFVVVEHAPGRATQVNRGVAEANSPFVCVLHADTLPPDDLVAVVRRTLSDPRVALAGFTPLLSGPEKVRWATSFHNWIKTWYAPLLFRPHLFVRGVRLLFGDHAMFFRRDQFLAVGGCDEGIAVMEEADLCIKLARFGRVRLVNRVIITSDRRVAAWGEWRANWLYLRVGVNWALGIRKRLGDHYPHVR